MRMKGFFTALALVAMINSVGCNRSGEAAAVAQAAEGQPDNSAESPGFAFAPDEAGRLAVQRLAAVGNESAEGPPLATAPPPWTSARFEQSAKPVLPPPDLSAPS